MKYRIKQKYSKVPCYSTYKHGYEFVHFSYLRCVCKISPTPYSLAVLSSVKLKVKDLITVFNTVPSMCLRFFR